MEASIKEQNEKTIGDLKQEWGKDYDNRMEDARKAFKDMGLEEDGRNSSAPVACVLNASVIIGISISY
jgi:hypothetical protein